ncbi:hypothetical protein DVH24_036690 [Malus domestica]|uniref:Uncharacterized protein n=1 Tax=Malus domestica TaxID=3750 RepID=A0A498IGZ3_MALDO|nr:hypothetical protein DVH24_036690 [Malus domestica]
MREATLTMANLCTLVQPAGAEYLAEDLLKAALPFGIEDWDQLEQVHNNFEGDFSNLRQAFEQGRKLRIDTFDNNNNVYLFRSTENEYEHVVIPTLVAVVPPSPPSLRDSNPNIPKTILRKSSR